MANPGRIKDVLYTREAIAEKVAELGKTITKDYADKEIFGVCLLKGSLVFCSDLMRHLDLPMRIDVMRASSYGASTTSSGSVQILKDLDTDIAGKDVLIIEDIVDTGRTLRKTLDLLEFRNPKSLKICTLLDKPCRREVDIDIDYAGFTIDDHFVVGYGLDYDEYYRNLPYIGILELDPA